MKIYFSPFPPFVRRCQVVGHGLGLGDRIELLPANVHPVQRDRDAIAKNPLGELPPSIINDEQALKVGRLLCEYLNELACGRLFPAPGRACWAPLKLQSLGDGLLDGAVQARYENAARRESTCALPPSAGVIAIRRLPTRLPKFLGPRRCR